MKNIQLGRDVLFKNIDPDIVRGKTNYRIFNQELSKLKSVGDYEIPPEEFIEVLYQALSYCKFEKELRELIFYMSTLDFICSEYMSIKIGYAITYIRYAIKCRIIPYAVNLKYRDMMLEKYNAGIVQTEDISVNAIAVSTRLQNVLSGNFDNVSEVLYFMKHHDVMAELRHMGTVSRNELMYLIAAFVR